MGRTWVVVSDACRARLFRLGPRRQWQLIRELAHPESRAKGRDILTDRPGRMKQSGSPDRPAMELTKPPHEVESERFAHEIARVLELGLAENAYDRLALVAPPHFLGLLRATINHSVAKHVELTFDKDYTALQPKDLAERVWL
jgi:protein required for attachment to host cells